MVGMVSGSVGTISQDLGPSNPFPSGRRGSIAFHVNIGGKGEKMYVNAGIVFVVGCYVVCT